MPGSVREFAGARNAPPAVYCRHVSGRLIGRPPRSNRLIIRRRPRLTLVIAGMFGLVIVAVVYRQTLLRGLLAVFEWIDALGPEAAFIFVPVYIVGIICFLPAAPFLIAGGAIFGLVLGVSLALIANLIGGSISFWLARTRLRGPLLRRFRHLDLVSSLDQAIAEDGLRTVLLIRTVPVLPSWSINYGLGLSPARYRHYLMGIFAAVPSFLMYTYSGMVANELAAILRGTPHHDPWYYGVLVAGLLAAIVVTVILSRRTRRLMGDS